MPRVLAFLFLSLVAAVMAKIVADQQQRRAEPGRFRPRKRWFRDTDVDSVNEVALSRAALAELRDALTGAPLAPDAELFRCAQCQSFYGVASVRALAQDNAARCVSCGSTKRVPVVIED